MKDYLEEIVECKYCHKEAKYGDFIWLNGEELCPECYTRKRRQLDEAYRKGVEDTKNKYNIDD